jgi:phosphoribosylformimino-5-aminoimidazole carboxamide ribotide isomerase
VTNMSDIDALLAVEDQGVEGAILGRSIYEGTLDFKAALDRVSE